MFFELIGTLVADEYWRTIAPLLLVTTLISSVSAVSMTIDTLAAEEYRRGLLVGRCLRLIPHPPRCGKCHLGTVPPWEGFWSR